MNKVTLFLLSERGYRVLQSVLANWGNEIIELIVLGRDRAIQKDYADEIVSLAHTHGLNLVERNYVFELNTAYAIAIGWRWIIDFDSAKTKLITIHDSLLPKYRGFSPLVSQLIQGESNVGVTAIFSNNEFDKGDIIGQQERLIDYPIKIQEAIEVVTELYSSLVNEIFAKLTAGKELIAVPQDHSKATYSLWRNEDDYQINWGKSAEEIKRFIDSVGFPYLGAFTTMDGIGIRVLDAVIENDVIIVNRDVGKILFMDNGYPSVVCGKGLIKLIQAVDIENNQSILPLKKFRIRFK